MHRPLLVLFGFLALCVGSLRAEEGKTDAPKSEAKPAPGSALVWNGQSTAKWYIDSIEKIVPLTEVQRQGMTDIMNARDKAVAEWQTQNAGKLQAAQKAMMDAYQGKDQEAIAKSQKEYQALSAPMQEIWKKHQPEHVLTPEQNEKIRDSRLMAMIKASTAPVELSQEQIKEIKAATAKDSGLEVWTTSNAAIQKVLTAEQKHAISKSRTLGYTKAIYAQAKLSDEQWKKIEAVCEELAKDQSIQPQDLYAKIKDKVDAILTPEQQEAVKSPWGAGGTIQLNEVQPRRTDSPSPAKLEKTEPQPGSPRSGSPQSGVPQLGSPRAQVTPQPGGGFQIIISEAKEEAPTRANPPRTNPPRTVAPAQPQLLPGQSVPEQPNTPRVIQLPGGGIHVIIGEEGAGQISRERHVAQVQDPQQMLANVKSQLTDRVKQQSKILRKSRKLLEKLNAASGNPAETHEIIEQLSRLQEELRQTNPGQPRIGLLGGGTSGAQWTGPQWTFSGTNQPQIGMPATLGRPAAPNPATPSTAPGAPATQPDPSTREILNQLQRLRQELDELRKQK